jgi:hypothetical protein
MQDQATLTRHAAEAADSARARLAAGFNTETARKDALYFVARAYTALRDLAHVQGLRTYDLPFDLHQYRSAKHAAMLGTALGAQVEALAELRGEIRAAAIVAKVKTKTAEQIRKDVESKTCQVCGRPIFAEAGVIAHHGYTRPWEGVQTASCPGARELPFEVDRALLAREIAGLEDAVADAAQRAADIEAERAPLAVSWKTKQENPNWRALPAAKRGFVDRYVKLGRPVTRETFEAVEAEFKASNRLGPHQTLSYGGFDALKRSALRTAQQRLAGLRADLATQQARYDGWRQTHRAGGAGEPVWVAL